MSRYIDADKLKFFIADIFDMFNVPIGDRMAEAVYQQIDAAPTAKVIPYDEQHKFCNLIGNALIYTKTLEDYNKLRADFRADTVRKLVEIIKTNYAVSKVHYVDCQTPITTCQLTDWQLDQIAKEILEGKNL